MFFGREHGDDCLIDGAAAISRDQLIDAEKLRHDMRRGRLVDV